MVYIFFCYLQGMFMSKPSQDPPPQIYFLKITLNFGNKLN